MPSTSVDEEAQLDVATDETDAAFAALLAVPTPAPAHLAAKLAAVIEHYDVFCSGLDRDLGHRLFGQIINALKQDVVQS